MIGLLLRCYPSRWRVRFGDEFAALLEERTLGPFDVTDVLLGALDAHLRLRGQGAAVDHRTGPSIAPRIGGYAAIFGSLVWVSGMAGNTLDGSDSLWPWLGMSLVGTMILLVALIGLSAFQARQYPRLTWAAFALPALGAVISLVGLVGMATTGDEPLVGDLSGWYLWFIGSLALFGGSGLFAIATWRSEVLSHRAAALLGAGSLVIVPAVLGANGGPETLAGLILIACITAYVGGWVALGLSALHTERAAPAGLQGVAS